MNAKTRWILGVLLYIAIFTLVFIQLGCTEDICDCEYVSYDDGIETYRSSWDASCENEVIDESVYTYSDGTKTYSRTEIQCK